MEKGVVGELNVSRHQRGSEGVGGMVDLGFFPPCLPSSLQPEVKAKGIPVRPRSGCGEVLTLKGDS